MTIASAPAPGGLAEGASADDRRVLKNAGVLFVGQALGLIVPLVTIPYLARVLGPERWGPVLAAQALGNWLLLILEFGFELSGTRAVAKARVSPETMVGVVHGVQSAKSILTLSSVVVLAIVMTTVPSLRADPTLALWAIVFAVFRGFSPLWYFQGVERVKGAVAVDSITRAVAALGVFFLVRSPSDGWWVLALQAIFSAVSLAVLMLWLAREVPMRRPAVGDGLRTLREGGSLFACRAWSGLYIQGNALILSALAGPAIVSFFGGAERIVRAAINLLQPLTQAFLPRVSYLRVSNPSAASAMIRRALLGVGLLGAVMGLTAFVAAPLLVHVLLGAGYDSAIPVLRLLGTLPFLVAVNTVFGVYWALPLGFDRLFLAAIIAAGITNLALALVLVPVWGATGMALSTIAAEVVVLAIIGVAYLRRPQ